MNEPAARARSAKSAGGGRKARALCDRKRPWASTMATWAPCGRARSARLGLRLSRLMMATSTPSKPPSSVWARSATIRAGAPPVSTPGERITLSRAPSRRVVNQPRWARPGSAGTSAAAQVTRPCGSKRIRLVKPRRRVVASLSRATHCRPTDSGARVSSSTLALSIRARAVAALRSAARARPTRSSWASFWKATTDSLTPNSSTGAKARARARPSRRRMVPSGPLSHPSIIPAYGGPELNRSAASMIEFMASPAERPSR